MGSLKTLLLGLLLSVSGIAGVRADSVVVVAGVGRDLHRDAIVSALSSAGITAEPGAAPEPGDGCEGHACLASLARARGTTHALRYVVEEGGAQGARLHVWLVSAGGLSGDAHVLLNGSGPAQVVLEAYHGARLALGLGGHGVLRIETTPVGASVRVDGELAGHAPLEVHLLPGGHAVSTELSGFAPARRRIDVEQGRAVVVEFELRRAGATAPPAALRDDGDASILNPIVGGLLIAASVTATVLAAGTLLSSGQCDARGSDGGCEGRVRFGYGDAALLAGGVLALGVGIYFVIEQPMGAASARVARPMVGGVAF